MRVALYTRVSTDDKGQDPLNQLLQLRDFSERQGWAVVRDTRARTRPSHTRPLTSRRARRAAVRPNPNFNPNPRSRWVSGF